MLKILKLQLTNEQEDVDDVINWLPPSPDHTHESLFSRCSERRTGSPNPSTNQLSDNHETLTDLKKLGSPPGNIAIGSLEHDCQFLCSRDLYFSTYKPSEKKLWEDLALRLGKCLPLPIKVLHCIEMFDRCFESEVAVMPSLQASISPGQATASCKRQDSVSDNFKLEHTNDWLEQLPIPLALRIKAPTKIDDLHSLQAWPTAPEMSPLPKRALSPDANACCNDSFKEYLYQRNRVKRLKYSSDRRLHYRRVWSVDNSDCSSISGSAGSGTSSGSLTSVASHASWGGRQGRPRNTYNIPVIKRKSNDVAERAPVQTPARLTPFLIPSIGPWSLRPTRQHFDTERPFQCTWCGKTFGKACDWKRHEESLHAPQAEWICLKDGPQVIVDARNVCVFCGCIDPNISHLRFKHRQLGCLDRASSHRRFDRKDHLIQHLLQSHGVTATSKYPLGLSGWEQPMHDAGANPLWRCGFCDLSGLSWRQRYVHVAGHMKQGKDVSAWHHCVCTRESIQTAVLTALESVGLHLYRLSCRQSWWCGTLVQPPGSYCDTTFVTHEEVLLHLASAHEEESCLSFGKRCASVGLPEEACVQFWCGYCQDTIPMIGFDSYDCSRLSHFSRLHSASTERWTVITAERSFKFYQTTVGILLQKDLLFKYPENVRFRIAYDFAWKLMEHQRQLGLASSRANSGHRSFELGREPGSLEMVPK